MSLFYPIVFVFMPPVPAEPPKQSVYFVKVDFVVINRVRSYSVEYDAWDRPTIVPHETVWVSFWDRLALTVIPTPGLRVGRGWWTMSQVRSITQATEGWIVESKDNINVITPEIRLIDSTFDWEMRNRYIFRPIRKP